MRPCPVAGNRAVSGRPPADRRFGNHSRLSGTDQQRRGAELQSIAATALPIVAFDYLENFAVAHMLKLGSEGIVPAQVAAASRWTLLKSAWPSVAMTLLLGLWIAWGVHKVRRRARSRWTQGDA